MQKFSRHIFVFLLGLFFLSPVSYANAEKITLYSDAPTSGVLPLSKALQENGLEAQVVSDNALPNLDGSRLLILASEKPISSAGQLAISRFLRAGGDAIVVGKTNFPAAPQPISPVPLGDFAREETFRLFNPQRPGSSLGEEPRVEKATAPGGQAALRLRTFKRDMVNYLVEFNATAARAPQRNVLTFQAKGDAFMDLMALEATDTSGRKYFAFAPLSQQWDSYAVSLADFVPEGWKDALQPYPLLDPAKIQTIALGTNRWTLWSEKPMDFSIADVALAQNGGGEYAPTAALNALQVPFQEIGITAPQWIFNPFFGSPSFDNTLQNAQQFERTSQAGSTPDANARLQARWWKLPPPYADFPGALMGTDTKKEYDARPRQSLRRRPLWQSADTSDIAAELRSFTGGTYAGAGVAVFGFEPGVLPASKALRDSIAHTAAFMLRRPQIVDVAINTTTQQNGGPIAPLLKITLRNPRAETVRGQLQADVADNALHGQTAVELKPRQSTVAVVELSAVPENFDFARFDWRVGFDSDAGRDEWRDTVDMERLLLRAAIHMRQSQQIYPDGRISNHYFADAYGARALLAYTNYLQKNPAPLQRNEDLWRSISPTQMREVALNFADMLVRRQDERGAVPMGYSEHTGSFNVADGGQLSLALITMAFEVGDETRRTQYLEAARRILDFSETFYIDEALYQKLKANKDPDLAKDKATAGFYGLGVYSGGKRRQSGPIWVIADLLAPQAAFTYAFPQSEYPKILERNTRLYLDHIRGVEGWYQGEAMIWSGLSINDKDLQRRLATAFDNNFAHTMYRGDAEEVYDAGSRGVLRALPLQYSRRVLGDSPTKRAALLKYVWTIGSETSSGSVKALAEAHPNPHHGASIAAMKLAEFSSIVAMELLSPNSTLLQSKNFPRAPFPAETSTTTPNATASQAADAPLVAPAGVAKSDLQLYLLVGQSNMAGRGQVEEIDREINPRVWSLGKDNQWIPAQEPLHFDIKNRGVGPGLAFAKAMRQAQSDPKANIGLIPAAVGGTLVEWWLPGAERHLFEDALARAKRAQQTGVLRGILWQQGESDSYRDRPAHYRERLLIVLRALRRELNAEDVPIVIGGLGDFLKSPLHKDVNVALQAVAGEIPNAVFVPASTKGHIGDQLHFNSAAARENGQNMAHAMLQLQKNSPKPAKAE